VGQRGDGRRAGAPPDADGRLPLAEQAKPRRIQIGRTGAQDHKMISESAGTASDDRRAATAGASA